MFAILFVYTAALRRELIRVYFDVVKVRAKYKIFYSYL